LQADAISGALWNLDYEAAKNSIKSLQEDEDFQFTLTFKKTEVERKLYPGYVFVNINLFDDEKELIERSWYYIRETPGVIGFADGDHPIPMRKKEVEGMLSQMREKEDKVVPKVLFELNDSVRVGDGPFEGQEGVIEEIDEERGRVRVAVSIFGRSTPVELEYWKVEKL